jgi:ABC-type uncharacterized transport system permease subunit
MNAFLLGILTIGAYLASSVWVLKNRTENARAYPMIYPAWLGLAGHVLYIGLAFSQAYRFNFSILSTASMVSALVVLLLLLATLSKPVEKLGIAIFPLAALMLGLDMCFPEKLRSLQTYNWEMGTHILSSVIAFSLLNIAALQALLLAIQEKQLRKHRAKKFFLHLPALQTMEALLFQMIAMGVTFLSLSLLTGMVFIDDLFAQHLVHKTVLSMIAWLVFSALLVGRWRYGWRGKIAIHWTIAGFILLLLAYFGSKFVLEIILKRI